MRDIADDSHGQVFEIRFVLPHGQQVEQALCRMRHLCLTRIQNTHVILDVTCDIGRYASAGIAYDKNIDLHRLQGIDGIENALALFAGRGIDVEIEHVRTKPLASQVEGRTGPRAGLEEQVGDRAPFESSGPDRGMPRWTQKGLGFVEDPANMGFAEALERQEMPQSTVGGDLQVRILYEARCFKQFGDVHGVAILTVRRTGSKDLSRFSEPPLRNKRGRHAVDFLFTYAAAKPEGTLRFQHLAGFERGIALVDLLDGQFKALQLSNKALDVGTHFRGRSVLVQGRADNQPGRAPLADNGGDRLPIRSGVRIPDCCHGIGGCRDVLTHSNTDPAKPEIERNDCFGRIGIRRARHEVTSG